MNWLKAWWPILVTLGAGLLGFGSLRADVQHLQEKAVAQATDHDMIVRTDSRVERIEKDITEIKGDIKGIAKAVKD